MMNLPIIAIIEFIIGIFVWWVAVYLISQNPYHRMVKLIFVLFTSISIYFSTDFFFYSAINTEKYYLMGTVLRYMNWAIYLPIALFYHISFGNQISPKQRIYIYLSYAITITCVCLETFTSLTRKYGFIASDDFKGDLASATGPFFWLSGMFIITISILSTLNLWKLIVKCKIGSIERKRLSVAFYGIVASVLISPLIILGYYNIIPHASFISSMSFLIMALPLFYSIVKYNLFIDDTKIVFGKNFLYSTMATFTIVFCLFIVFLISGTKFETPQSMVLPFLLIYLLIASHPAYNWFSTFTQDIIYNIKSGLSVANDQEIYSVLRSYSNPEKLEESTLLRLSLIAKNQRKDSISQVDSLRSLIKESIEYFKPESEPHRRIKSNLKYHLLTMLVFDDAEEGQILWELGFEEYPVKIMSQERRYRPPLFEIKSPADYTYTSRNAFIALKKEAIHDITWRISYLEKHSKKN